MKWLWPAIAAAVVVVALVITLVLVKHHQAVEERRSACQFEKVFEGYSDQDATILCADA